MASILAVHLRDETVTRISFHFTFQRKGGGGCHVTVALQPMYFFMYWEVP